MALNLSVSLHGYKSKKEIKKETESGKMRFIRRQLKLSEFEKIIADGHGFCHWFKTQGDEFPIYKKKDENFARANVVFVDVDDYTMEMNEFVSRLEKKPTLYYTSWSNNPPNYHFRLCYAFEDDILNKDTFANTYNAIIASIRMSVTDYPNKDKCGRSVSQLMFGNGSDNCDVKRTGIIYSLSDFGVGEVTYTTVKEETKHNEPQQVEAKKEKEEKEEEDIKFPINDKEFMKDFEIMQPSDLIYKYRGRYNILEHSELHYENGYALLGEDYYEIFRPWFMDKVPNKSGDVRKVPRQKKYRDGDKRRTHLFVAALLRRLIKPTITFEELLYNLVYDRLYYYDNSDHMLTNRLLKVKAREVVELPQEKVRLRSRNKHKFKVDKAYCRELGITTRKMCNMVRRLLKDIEIGELYDCGKSVAENLKEMKEQGLKISRRRLYDFCNEHDIPLRDYKKRRRTEWEIA